MSAIQIENLRVAYDGKAIIDGLSLNIERGSLFTLLGPSGCGKTTLLRTIAGFNIAEKGSIRFGEQDVSKLPAHQRNIGMVFQDYALFPDKTVHNNIAYGLRARQMDEATISRKVGAVMERVGLQGLGTRLPAALSGGQRQRVALARALVIEPQVLLMDEPLSNLDAKLRVQVRQTIAQLQADSGITTVFVTHDQEEALALSHQIGVMREGRLEQIATPAQIYRQPGTAYVADFVGAANLLPLTLAQAVPAGEVSRISTPYGELLATAPASLPASEAHIAVRAEAIVMQVADDLRSENNSKLRNEYTGSSTILAKIVGKQFLGQKTSYLVELAPKSTSANPPPVRWTVDSHGAAHDAHAVGASVQLILPAASTWVLAS